MAADTDPELAGQFVYPSSNVAQKVLITSAKAMLATATGATAQLMDLGLGATTLDTLSASVTQFDGTTESAHAGRRSHVGARAELVALIREISKLVAILDGLNQAQYTGDPERLAAWDSAKTVFSLSHSAEPVVPVPVPAPPVPEPAAHPAEERPASNG